MIQMTLMDPVGQLHNLNRLNFKKKYKKRKSKILFDKNISMILSTEDTILEKYEKYDTEIVNMLRGDFSFALYDQKKNIIFAARDPLGTKSLYYTKTESKYHFSFTINDLLSLSEVKKIPNLKSMATMLECQAVNNFETMYENIYRLPPGYSMTINIDSGNKTIERYWHPEKIEIDNDISEDEASRKVYELFYKAIYSRIDDLDETAFELSGGLDSSSVVAILTQKENASSISSYSMEFDNLDCDESKYIDAILSKSPLNHQIFRTANINYKDKYSLNYLYTLSPDWPIVTTFAMSIPMVEQMVADGKKIILTGQGGDHLFTGTPYVMNSLLRRGKFISLAKELRYYKHPLRVFRDYALRPFLSSNSIEIIKKLLGKKPTDPFELRDCNYLAADFTSNIKDPARKLDLDLLTWAMHTTMMDSNIFHCMEKQFGVEYRHPFFDRDLVELVLSLPPEMKYKNRKIKWIWREAMKGILLEKVRQRTDKAEFSEIIMRQIDAIDLDELLDDPCIVKLKLISREKIDRYIKSYKKRSKKYTIALWSAINVEYWYRYNGFDCE